MSSDTNGLQRLREYSGAVFSNYEYVANPMERDLRVSNGVVLLMAFWSGPAVLGFKNICETFSSIALPHGFEFIVFDIDGSEEFIERFTSEGINIGGNAEALWYKKGTVIAGTSLADANPVRIRELVEEIRGTSSPAGIEA